MAYAALVSLANTIDRFLNQNLFPISLEEKQQILSLLEYVPLFQGFLDEFPDKFKSLEGRMREAACEAEDILEYLVLEKVFLPKSHPSGDEAKANSLKGRIRDMIGFYRWKNKWRYLSAEFAKFKSKLHLNKTRNEIVSIMEETRLKLKKVMEEFGEDSDEAKAHSLEDRIREVDIEVTHMIDFCWWSYAQTHFRYKWRYLPAEFAKFKSKLQFIHHLNKTRNEIDSIMEELMAIKNNSDTSSSKLVPIDDIVGLHDYESICHRSAEHELQLGKVMEEIASIAAQVKKIKHSSTIKEIQSSAISSSPTPPIHTDSISMVGFDEHLMDLKERLCGESSKLQVIPICGMGGIGKTTLARSVYDDPLIVYHFVIRVWVTVSQDFSERRILSSILKSLEEYSKGVKGQSDDEKVHKILMGRKYLVVMDDIWSGEAWDVVRRVFPDNRNGSRVVLTTRSSDVASYPDTSSKLHEMSLLNADQSWDLFKQKVFGDEDCPSELENIGKEIARSCKGLPLAIVVIAGLLSTVRKNPTSWLEIAKNVKSAETAEHNQIEEILSLSYAQLPQYLRQCFLYMGSFREDEKIHVSRLIRLWVAEGFLDSKSFEKAAEECLEELVKRNLVLVTKRKFDGRIKKCSLHDLMRDLCIRKAHESNFFRNMMDMDIGKEHFIESIKGERRVSVRPSYKRYLSSCDGSSSTIHSIKFSYSGKVTLDFGEGVRLLRVLDAKAVDVELLPSHLYEQFHLRYFAVRYSNSIPRALSCLQNLQTLILHRSSARTIIVHQMLMPWWMPQIRHVYFHGEIYFENPIEATCSLENLQTLSLVRSACCTEQILKRIPNLKKMKMDCPSDGDAACLNDLVHLNQLENFKVFGGDLPHNRSKYYNYTFPKTLKKLSLTKLELPSSDITVVGSLPNLQVLKFRNCGFADRTWETTQGAFPVLEVLLVQSRRFENWITESSHFPRLKHLLLHSCKGLSRIPYDIGEIPTLQLIEVRGGVIKKSLRESVEQIQQEQEELGNNALQVLCIAKLLI